MIELIKKIFSFNKFFIAFCVFFILVLVTLQIVAYMRMIDQAKLDGTAILAWNWPDKNTRSIIEVYDTKVIKKDHNNAIIKIIANQIVESSSTKNSDQEQSRSEQKNKKGETIPAKTTLLKNQYKCAATLTYYRTNKQWFIGKVECE